MAILLLYFITFTSDSLCYPDWHLCSATQTICTEHLLHSRHCSMSWDPVLNKSLSSLWAGGEQTKIRQTCQVTSSRKKNKAGTGYRLMVRMAPLMWCLNVDWGSKPQFEAVWGSVFQAGETAVAKALRWHCMDDSKGASMARVEWMSGQLKDTDSERKLGPDHIASL